MVGRTSKVPKRHRNPDYLASLIVKLDLKVERPTSNLQGLWNDEFAHLETTQK